MEQTLLWGTASHPACLLHYQGILNFPPPARSHAVLPWQKGTRGRAEQDPAVSLQNQCLLIRLGALSPSHEDPSRTRTCELSAPSTVRSPVLCSNLHRIQPSGLCGTYSIGLPTTKLTHGGSPSTSSESSSVSKSTPHPPKGKG